MKKGIAFFDMDGTITSKDTFLDFIIFCRGEIFFWLGLILLSPYIFLYGIKLYPNYKLKEIFFKIYLAKYLPEKLEELGKLYSINILNKIIYNDALERIQWHKKCNHRIIILTASSPIWLKEWCALNKIELIGTQFEVSNGKYTGKILGENCHGLQKQNIVNNLISVNDELLTYGYGNSKSDILFLNIVQNKYYKPFNK